MSGTCCSTQKCIRSFFCDVMSCNVFVQRRGNAVYYKFPSSRSKLGGLTPSDVNTDRLNHLLKQREICLENYLEVVYACHRHPSWREAILNDLFFLSYKVHQMSDDEMHRAPSQLSCNVSSIVFTLQLNGCGGASLTVITWPVCWCLLLFLVVLPWGAFSNKFWIMVRFYLYITIWDLRWLQKSDSSNIY